jgi:cell division protein FtsI (penicillin-binding protein 3)
MVEVPGALNSTVFCHDGSYDKDDILIKDVTPYRNLSPREVLAHSSNIGTAKMAMAVGSPRFWNVIANFGFGRRTGVELPYESSGGIPLPEYADKKVLPGMGFGRMILVTPIEMLKFFCALANGGMEVRPTLLADHKVDRVERRSFSPETALILRDALKESAKEAEVGKTPDGKVTLAGKTGTGLGFDKNGNFSKKRYVTSFAGYFPADHPKIAAIVVVDDASVTEEKNTGTSLAAPFFAEIAQKTSEYLRLREQ